MVAGEGGAPAGEGGGESDPKTNTFDGGGAPAGGAGASGCAAMDDCATPENDDYNGLVNDGCRATGYSLGQEPDTGAFSYFDELHNIATSGSPSDNSLHQEFASGQLLDGTLGPDDYHVDLGSGAGYEWVGWSFEEVVVVFEFAQPRDIEKVVLGTLSRTGGNVFEPIEVRVSFSTDGTTFAPATAFALADATLPVIADGARADITLAVPKTTARYARIRLVPGGKWIFLDEVSFD